MGWNATRQPAPPAGRVRLLGSILWALLPLVTWGLLAPVPFVHAAVRLRTYKMWLVAAVYTVASLAVGPFELVTSTVHASDEVRGLSQLALVVVATTHALFLRDRVFGPLASPRPSQPPAPADPIVAAALAARQRREQATRIAIDDPALARELRIGRPDLPRQFDDGGLVDVNQVPARILVDLLGLSSAEARRVVQTRARLGGFTSRTELTAFADLPEPTVEALGDRLLFLGK